jgi:hypothetical protein
MRFSRLLLPVLALGCLGFAERPPEFSVRFFAEANARDGRSFSTPMKLGNPPRDGFVEKVPSVHERQISSIFPFRAADGTWGCAFKLDNDGRINLEVVSTERRGTFLVGFIGTNKGQHRLPDMIIDRTVTDGIISVPHGLTDLEIAILSKQFKVLGGGTAPKLKKAPRSWNPFKKAPAEQLPATES